ncbi:MAG: tyrosine-type recombinase/integrase [Lachnospiraceae bacterium]|nr:tyrosine-type recombinase/integrase [Lachnospiraceae bacterium]
MKPQTLTRALHRYQDKLGIERFRLHDFRHYFASYAHSLGIPGVYIIKAGGWKTDHVMKTVYRDVLKDKNLEMQRKKSRTICFLFRDKFRDKFL